MTADATFRVIEADDEGAFQWQLRAADGSVLATSGDVYRSEEAAMRDIQRVKYAAPDAGVTSTADAA